MIKKFFMPEHNTMKQTYFWTMLAGMTYAGSSFVMSMLTSNVLGASMAGVLALALSIGNQLVTIGYYNIRTFQVSDVREKYSFADYCTSRLITITVMILAGAVWIYVDGYQGEKLIAIAIMVGFKICEAVSDLFEGRYQQKERYDISCRGVFIKTAIYLIGFAAVLLLTKNLLISLAVLTLLYAVSIIVIDSRLIGCFGKPAIHFQWKKQWELLVAGFPLFINAFLTTYILNAPKYAIDKYYGDSYLGVFNSLYMMAFIINLFASFVLKPIIATLAILYDEDNEAEFMALVKRQIIIIVSITIICIMGAYLLGVQVLTVVFGIDMTDYKKELCIILIGGTCTALYQLFQYCLVIMRKQYSCFAGCMITAVETWALTPVLVKKAGVAGATYSYVLSVALMTLFFLVFFLHFMKNKKEEYKID